MSEKEKSFEMVKLAVKALDDKQGEEIRVLDITHVSVLADYFIIAHGRNKNHIKALVDGVDELLSKNGYEPKNIEGGGNSNWTLMDYRDIIIHVFDEEARYFYALERIWADGKAVEVPLS